MESQLRAAGDASSTDAEDFGEMHRQLRDVRSQLRYKTQLLDVILDRMVQGLMLVNKDLVVEVCNRRAIELLDLPPTLMARGPRFIEVLEYQWSTNEFANTPEELKRFVRDGGILEQPQCYERVRPNGRVIEIQSVPLGDGGVLRTYMDVTERRRDNERMRRRARYDGLTSLLNRESFIEVLTENITAAVSGGRGFAVHYLDLDGFKPVNDSMGHFIGDQVLASVAGRIRMVAREHDAVARMGGDEFAILQVSVDNPDQALGLCNRLLRLLDVPIEVEGQMIRIGFSAGIAIFPVHGVTADALIRNADSALYRVKAAGGQGVQLFG